MLRIGPLRLLLIALLGLVLPFCAYWLRRRIGLGPLLLLAALAGLGYGAVKADNPWNGAGLEGNLLLMATAAAVALAYIGVAVAAAGMVAKAASSIRL
jgi:hypothetical protein